MEENNLIIYFVEKDRYREQSLKLSREIVRTCSMYIRQIHKNNINNIDINKLKNNLTNLNNLVKKNNDLLKYVNTPQQEFVECVILYNIKYHNNILSYNELENKYKINIIPENYLLGLCDTIGELRRMILENIKNDNIYNCKKYYDIMEELYDYIMLFDYYNVIDGLRRKQDVCRSILEKTNSDLVYFMENIKLRKALVNKK